MRVLVTYATRHGATREVGAEVAATLRAAGCEVDFHDTPSVGAVGGYDLVVLGSPLYAGRLLRPLRRFVRRHRSTLEHTRIALFALGPLSLREEEWAEARAQLDAEVARLRLEHASVALFGGVIDLSTLSLPFRAAFAARAGDYRDWTTIRAWAQALQLGSGHPVS